MSVERVSPPVSAKPRSSNPTTRRQIHVTARPPLAVDACGESERSIGPAQRAPILMLIDLSMALRWHFLPVRAGHRRVLAVIDGHLMSSADQAIIPAQRVQFRRELLV